MTTQDRRPIRAPWSASAAEIVVLPTPPDPHPTTMSCSLSSDCQATAASTSSSTSNPREVVLEFLVFELLELVLFELTRPRARPDRRFHEGQRLDPGPQRLRDLARARRDRSPLRYRRHADLAQGQLVREPVQLLVLLVLAPSP